MKRINEIVQLMNNLPNEEKKLLLKLDQEDKEVFGIFLRKILRLKHVVDTGNIIVWKKIMNLPAAELRGIRGGEIKEKNRNGSIEKIARYFGLENLNFETTEKNEPSVRFSSRSGSK